MANALHELCDLIKSDVSERDGGIAVMEILVYLLALAESCDSAVLPMDRACVGQRSLKRFVSAHKRSLTKSKSLGKDLPELILVSP